MTLADDRVIRVALLGGGAVSLAISIALASQAVDVGSREGGWVYSYVQDFTPRMLLPAAVAILGAAAALRCVDRSRRMWLALLAAILAATAFQAALRPLAPFPFERLVSSPGANGFYTVAATHGPAEVLRSFARVKATAPLHAQSNMPGKILLVHLLAVVSTDPSVIAWLLVAISNLGAIFMYLFVRDVFDDRRIALFAAILYLFVPARLFFLPLMNTVTPVPALAGAWFLARWLRTGHTGWALATGVALYGLAFFEPLPLVLGLLFGALTARAIARNQITWPRVFLHLSAMLVAFIAVSEMLNWLTGFEIVATGRRLAAHAAAFNESAGRPYGVWVFANLWEFLLGVGAVQAAASMAVIVLGLGDRTASLRARLTDPVNTLAFALVAVLLALDVLGLNRGEVVRLWIFLACFFQIPAAYACARFAGPCGLLLVVATSALVAAIGASTIGFVVP